MRLESIGLLPDDADPERFVERLKAGRINQDVSCVGVSVLLGPNGCGKSTILKQMAEVPTGRQPALVTAQEVVWEDEGAEILGDLNADESVLERLVATAHPAEPEWVGLLVLPRADRLLLSRPNGDWVDFGVPAARMGAVWDRFGLPRMRYVDAVSAGHDVDGAVSQTVEAALGYLDPAQPSTDERLTSIRTVLLRYLTGVLNHQTPNFLTGRGPLRVVDTDDPVRPQQVVTRHAGGEAPLAEAGLGLRRWATVVAMQSSPAVIDLAAWANETLATKRLDDDFLKLVDMAAHTGRSWLFGTMREDQRDPSTSTDRFRTVLLLDEPEAHLHQLAQQQVAQWLADATAPVGGDLQVVAASHSPAMLRGDDHWRLYEVQPDVWASPTTPSTPPQITNITATLLDRLTGPETHQGSGSAGLGFDESAWTLALRALLLVEGTQDVDVLTFFAGSLLQSRRVLVVPLRGYSHWKRVANSPVARAMPWRQYYWFDQVSVADIISARDSGTLLSSNEAKAMAEILQLADDGLDLRPVPFDLPDIMCAIKPSVAARRWPHARKIIDDMTGMDDWAGAIVAWREAVEEDGGTNFKRWLFTQQLGMEDPPTRRIDDLIDALEEGDTPTAAFQLAIDTLLADLDS